jgi:hypothetical protein
LSSGKAGGAGLAGDGATFGRRRFQGRSDADSSADRLLQPSRRLNSEVEPSRISAVRSISLALQLAVQGIGVITISARRQSSMIASRSRA